MQCPNCKKPFVVERDGKCQCWDCGWFQQVDNEWRNIDEPVFDSSPELGPEPEPVQEPSPEPSPAALEPNPAALEPNPAALEPDPASQEPSPEPPHSVKEYLGGLITVTEIDE